jgi:hypothetical protein
MNKAPIGETERKAIEFLQEELDQLRKRAGISDRGCVLYRADLSYGDDDVVIVEADGFGGATLRVVEGNWPVDYFTHEEQEFATESDAVNAAELRCRRAAA